MPAREVQVLPGLTAFPSTQSAKTEPEETKPAVTSLRGWAHVVGKQSPSLTKTPQQGIQEPGVAAPDPQRPPTGTGPPVTAGPEQPS